MPVTLFSLPLGVRDRIYQYVWSDLRSVRICSTGFGPWEEHYFPEENIRYPEEVVRQYPPRPAVKGADGGDGDDEDGWEDVDSEDEKKGDAGQGRTGASKKAIEFDVREFLANFNEDEEDLEDDFEDGYSSEEDSDVDEIDALQRPRYKVRSWPPVNLGLCLVNRRLNAEATPIFYGNANFVLDCDAVDAIRMRLPESSREVISTLTITGNALMGDDRYCREAWSGKIIQPQYRDASTELTLVTPFASFLATEVPILEHVYFYLPCYGDEDWYCSYAPTELSMLLKYGFLKRLSFVFLSDKVAEWLEKQGSEECYETLMGNFKDCGKVAEHEFRLCLESRNLGHLRRRRGRRVWSGWRREMSM